MHTRDLLAWASIRHFAFLFVLPVLFSNSAAARILDCTEIVVSPSGAPAASGGPASGESAASRSIASALEKVRKLRALHPDERVCLSFMSGEYFLTSPIRIGRAEAGGSGATTVLQKYDAGSVTLSGGVKLQKLKGSTRSRWIFDVGGVCNDVRQRSLFVGGRRRMRARLPAKGFFMIAGEVARRMDRGVRVDAFRYDREVVPGSLTINDASEIIAYHYWSMSRLGIRDVDRVQNIITLNGMASHTDIWARFAKSEKFYFENVGAGAEGELQTGEWLQSGSRIQYRPTDDELNHAAGGDSSVVLPCTQRLLEIADGAHDLTIDGLRFIYSGGGRVGYRVTPAQAGIGPDTSATIELRSASRVSFSNVEISSTADLGILFDRGTRQGIIKNSTLRDLGAGAIAIGDPVGAYTKASRTGNINSENEIANNTIRDGGRIRQDAVAIWIGDVGGNRVTANKIANFDYTAISVGWVWGGMKKSRRNIIDGNVIESIGHGELSDLGGIYTMSDLSGTVIRNNSVSHVGAAKYGGFGMYFDRGSSGMVVDHNRIVDAKSAGIALHYAYNNVIKDNSICVTGVPRIYVIKPGIAANVVDDNLCKN